MTIQAAVMGIAANSGSPAIVVTADLTEIVELRRERLFDGADISFDQARRETGAEASTAWQRLARQRLGIGTALIDVDNALAYAIDVGPQIILYRVIVAQTLPRHLDLGALFASGEVAAARFAANGIVEWVKITGAGNVNEARLNALRQGATPLGRVFALGSLPAEGGLRLIATGGDPLTLDLVPPSVSGHHFPQARRFAWNEPDTPMSYGFGTPAAEQMPGGLAALFSAPWQ
ncbi:hypothetical protein [Dongia sp.]|uniref:hypothetical protein n=1 Tax=Dongia sp. TaxID=1977262 RepID=UPI0035AFDBA4